MAGMPEMQEHFPASAHGIAATAEMQEHYRLMAMDGRYAESAVAPGTSGHFPLPCGSAMLEQLPANGHGWPANYLPCAGSVSCMRITWVPAARSCQARFFASIRIHQNPA